MRTLSKNFIRGLEAQMRREYGSGDVVIPKPEKAYSRFVRIPCVAQLSLLGRDARLHPESTSPSWIPRFSSPGAVIATHPVQPAGWALFCGVMDL